jgi:hypothetical protein
MLASYTQHVETALEKVERAGATSNITLVVSQAHAVLLARMCGVTTGAFIKTSEAINSNGMNWFAVGGDG